MSLRMEGSRSVPKGSGMFAKPSRRVAIARAGIASLCYATLPLTRRYALSVGAASRREAMPLAKPLEEKALRFARNDCN